jgi:ornithine cyclodeaminase/alanine dehydrogenase-like protein (mu-crystallin family)
MPARPTLLLSRSVVSRLATPKEYIAAMRSAFVDLAEGRVELASVGHVPGTDGAFHIKAATRAVAPAFAVVKVNGNFPDNSGRYHLPTIQGFIALLDAECGSVLALMDSSEITARRTAAATALAAQYLADPDTQTLGIVGCGVQARYHLDALVEIAGIETVLYCDPNAQAASSFATYIESRGLQARRAPDAKTACDRAGIVVTLTTSTHPILELADVAPGTFVAGVGADNPLKHELAPDLLCASHVVVDSMSQAAQLGDLHHAIDCGKMVVKDIYSELSDLVVGRAAGRKDNSQRWVFDSTGLAVQDLAAATMLYELARGSEDIPRMLLID